MDDLETQLKRLMLRGLDGDANAHRRLLSLLSERLRAYYSHRMASAHADVEDLVQETLLAVHLRRASYDRGQPFTAWAFAIARYKLIDHWRRRKSAPRFLWTTWRNSSPPRRRTLTTGWT